MTYADIFTGFGGATIGAMQAGLKPLWGIEYDADIAAVANQNLGDHVMVADILDVDPATLPRVDVLHASPECKRASSANNSAEINGDGTKENGIDIAHAQKVAEFISEIQPKCFTLENVYAYRNFKSWTKIIAPALYENGYEFYQMEHVNAADYQVPQTRKRMIVRAVKGGWVPMLPQPDPWIGWYEAIEDLIPELPDSQFAPWQLKRLPEELRTMLVAQGGYDGTVVNAAPGMPSFTVTSNGNQTKVKAMLVPGDNASNSTIRLADEPMVTVQTRTPGQCTHRAFIGKVVSMTPRALARFQSFPDWYTLPEKATLACRGIGNAVPPLLYEKIVRQLIDF